MRVFEVVAYWDGELNTHIAYNMVDAMEWVACYPAECKVRVWTGNYCVCSRG